MSKLSKALIAAAGNAGGAGLTVEDVFSTYLYTGNGSTQTINNGIDLDGEGGMVWIKNRGAATTDHRLFDTNRGIYKSVSSNLTDAEDTSTSSLTAFNSSGFSLSGFNAEINDTGNTYASWTFRKAEKFFDVVTFSGNGASSQSISHNLGSVPAMIITKSLNNGYRWNVWHIGLGVNTNPTYANMLFLQTTDQTQLTSSGGIANPTDTSFDVGGVFANKSGDSYVAYLFASDAGGFGDDGSESIIKCGSYEGTGADVEVNLGFEPQWLMIKNADAANSWLMVDCMRGAAVGGNEKPLSANTSSAESASGWNELEITATGFIEKNSVNSGQTYIYIAIRRPMKTPESGTEVFAADFRFSAEAQAVNPASQYYSGFPVDLHLNLRRTGGGVYAYSRIQGGSNFLRTSDTSAEVSSSTSQFDSNVALYPSGSTNSENTDQVGLMFKRATGFFDVVAYTGDGVTGRTVNHNLGVAPELLIVKRRSGTSGWSVYSSPTGNSSWLQLESVASVEPSGLWASTTPTSDAFYVTDASGKVNYSGETYIAYLFASLAGVSKVGSYTGNGTSQTIDCGFSGGARFILIKSTSTTGSWWVYDSARGIVAGNDPALQLNSTAAEVTSADAIDPDSSGFIVNQEATCSINASGVSYIFMSIA